MDLLHCNSHNSSALAFSVFVCVCVKCEYDPFVSSECTISTKKNI